MNVVLLIYVLGATQHAAPNFPKFFIMYRTEAACAKSAARYMEQNGKSIILVNAVCVDSTNPALVPYLRDVVEVEDAEIEI